MLEKLIKFNGSLNTETNRSTIATMLSMVVNKNITIDNGEEFQLNIEEGYIYIDCSSHNIEIFIEE